MTILVQISDTHLMAPASDGACAHERSAYLRRCVKDINCLDPKPDAVIHTGDMTQHAYCKEYYLAREILGQLKMPLYVTPGNRDSRAAIRDIFRTDDYSPPDADFIHYATNVGAIRLVAIDTINEEGTRPGNLCDTRIAAIDVTLGQAPHTPTALFMHHPPFDVLTSSEPFQFINREAVEKFSKVLQRHSQIKRVFCGHAHRCYVTEISNTSASTLPSVAVDLRLGDYPEAMKKTPVYQIHRFHPETGFVSETRLVI
jgi:Icc protein